MTSWRLWASTASESPRTNRVADGPAFAAFQAQLAGQGQEPLEDGGVDVGRQGFGGRPAEHLDLLAQVEDDHGVDRARAVQAGHADDPVALADRALGGGDQGGHLDLADPGHRHVGHQDHLRSGRPSLRGSGTGRAGSPGSPAKPTSSSRPARSCSSSITSAESRTARARTSRAIAWAWRTRLRVTIFTRARRARRPRRRTRRRCRGSRGRRARRAGPSPRPGRSARCSGRP